MKPKYFLPVIMRRQKLFGTRTELNDVLKYQYFEGIAAAASEALFLYLPDKFE